MDENKKPMPIVSAFDQLAEWLIFYRIFFGREQQICSSVVPAFYPGFEQLILVLKGLGALDFIKASSKLFPVRIPPEVLADLKAGIPSERRKVDDYAVWIRGGIESERRAHATQNLKFKKLPFYPFSRMALDERLAFGLFYFWKHQKLVDQHGATLCMATQDKAGRIPEVTCAEVEEFVGKIRRKKVTRTAVFISPWQPDATGEIPEYLGLREVKF